MNIIFLDYDISHHNMVEKIHELYDKRKDVSVYSLKDGLPADFHTDEPVRGVVLTALQSGWMKYHSEIAEHFPFVSHWVFCVVGMSGNALKETVASQFWANIANDTYCELIFDDASLSNLNEKLKLPIKSKKKCLALSLNPELSKDVRNVLQEYLPEWDVVDSSDPKPDCSLCDSVFIVGNQFDEMMVAKPEIPSARVCFWMNKPYFASEVEMAAEKALLGKCMNEAGWNIGDYSSLAFFSSIHHEQVWQQICKEEITPIALLSDPLFVLWDDYGLPQVQSALEDEDLRSFLASHTVLQMMADQFCGKKRGEKK